MGYKSIYEIGKTSLRKWNRNIKMYEWNRWYSRLQTNLQISSIVLLSSVLYIAGGVIPLKWKLDYIRPLFTSLWSWLPNSLKANLMSLLQLLEPYHDLFPTTYWTSTSSIVFLHTHSQLHRPPCYSLNTQVNSNSESLISLLSSPHVLSLSVISSLMTLYKIATLSPSAPHITLTLHLPSFHIFINLLSLLPLRLYSACWKLPEVKSLNLLMKSQLPEKCLDSTRHSLNIWEINEGWRHMEVRALGTEEEAYAKALRQAEACQLRWVKGKTLMLFNTVNERECEVLEAKR